MCATVSGTLQGLKGFNLGCQNFVARTLPNIPSLWPLEENILSNDFKGFHKNKKSWNQKKAIITESRELCWNLRLYNQLESYLDYKRMIRSCHRKSHPWGSKLISMILYI